MIRRHAVRLLLACCALAGAAAPASACRPPPPDEDRIARLRVSGHLRGVVVVEVLSARRVGPRREGFWRATGAVAQLVSGPARTGPFDFSPDLCGPNLPVPVRGERWVLYLLDSGNAPGGVYARLARPLAVARAADGTAAPLLR